MAKYQISYWEQESVWVRRTVQVECEEKPTPKHAKVIILTNPTDYIQSDYDWETSEHLCYDFETDFEVEELENEEN